MEIIPVIDLLNGCVVHAQRGQRNQYQPIKTPLCDSSNPLDIVEALLKLYPFRQLYIADLDAIQRQGGNAATILSIREQHPQLEIWLDGGYLHPQELKVWRKAGITCVLGSENIANLDQYGEMMGYGESATILSLDFSAGYMGPEELLAMPHLWPERVILMTLAQVGSKLGPDLKTLQTIFNIVKDRHPAPLIYAAGGIRHLADIMSLAAIGTAGILVATALHNGSITPGDLARLEP